MSGARSERSERLALVLVLLATVSGAADAIAFVALGSVFVSVQTGNLVLLGAAATSGATGEAWHAVLSVAAYAVGVAAGSRVARAPQAGDPPWPRQVRRALLLEAALLGVFGVGWLVSGGAPGPSAAGALLGVGAAAMGVQSAAVLRLGLGGVATTYLTGTLTSLVAAAAHGRRHGQELAALGVLAAVVVAAALAVALVRRLPSVAGLLPVVLLLVALVAAAGLRSGRDRP